MLGVSLRLDDGLLILMLNQVEVLFLVVRIVVGYALYLRRGWH